MAGANPKSAAAGTKTQQDAGAAAAAPATAASTAPAANAERTLAADQAAHADTANTASASATTADTASAPATTTETTAQTPDTHEVVQAAAAPVAYPPALTAAAAAAMVQRTRILHAPGATPRTQRMPVFPSEVLAFRDYGTHVVVVTNDGQKFSSAAA